MLTLYSNEIVFRGHPDKVCDQISDALLTAHLREDKNSRCGIEVVGGKRMIFITGEVTSKAYVNIQEITKAVLSDIGYNPDEYQIVIDISRQSPDIAQGVDIGGAGDQGMMFGYACNDTYEYPFSTKAALNLSAKRIACSDTFVYNPSSNKVSNCTPKSLPLASMPPFCLII